eukprot:356949-Chlamydomonas_euryale.AAC.6
MTRHNLRDYVRRRPVPLASLKKLDVALTPGVRHGAVPQPTGMATLAARSHMQAKMRTPRVKRINTYVQIRFTWRAADKILAHYHDTGLANMSYERKINSPDRSREHAAHLQNSARPAALHGPARQLGTLNWPACRLERSQQVLQLVPQRGEVSRVRAAPLFCVRDPVGGGVQDGLPPKPEVRPDGLRKLLRRVLQDINHGIPLRTGRPGHAR